MSEQGVVLSARPRMSFAGGDNSHVLLGCVHEVEDRSCRLCRHDTKHSRVGPRLAWVRETRASTKMGIGSVVQ